jgi:TPR repeat protein
MMNVSFQEMLKKAESGDIRAQYAVAAAYFEGEDVEKDYAQAVEWFRKAAESGCAESAYQLGWMCDYGCGLKEDTSEAAKWYDKSLALGIEDPFKIKLNAIYIADAYYFGTGEVSKNHPEALRWYRLAVEGGCERAAHMLGNMCASGEGVPKDDVEAARWYQKSIEMDHDAWDSMYKLGLIYRDGTGVPKDSEVAEGLLFRAASKGHTDAQYALGMMLLAENTYAYDGMDWFRVAAERGHVLAQLAQGEAEEECGMLGGAFAWYSLAFSNGNSSARTKLDLLIPRMSPDDRARGQEMANVIRENIEANKRGG